MHKIACTWICVKKINFSSMVKVRTFGLLRISRYYNTFNTTHCIYKDITWVMWYEAGGYPAEMLISAVKSSWWQSTKSWADFAERPRWLKQTFRQHSIIYINLPCIKEADPEDAASHRSASSSVACQEFLVACLHCSRRAWWQGFRDIWRSHEGHGTRR